MFAEMRLGLVVTRSGPTHTSAVRVPRSAATMHPHEQFLTPLRAPQHHCRVPTVSCISGVMAFQSTTAIFSATMTLQTRVRWR